MKLIGTFLFCFTCVSTAHCMNCDPESVKNSLLDAIRCGSGGYQNYNQKIEDDVNFIKRSIEAEELKQFRIEYERRHLAKLDEELKVWEKEIERIGKEIISNPSKKTALELETLRQSLVIRGSFDIRRLDDEIRRNPSNEETKRMRTILQRIVDSLIDAVIPQPWDLIPLRKPWKTIRSAINAYQLFKEHWLEW